MLYSLSEYDVTLAVFLVVALNIAGIVKLVMNWENMKYRWLFLVLCLIVPFGGIVPLLSRTDTQHECDEREELENLKERFNLTEKSTRNITRKSKKGTRKSNKNKKK